MMILKNYYLQLLFVIFAILLQTIYGRKVYCRHRHQKKSFENLQNTSTPQNSGNPNRNDGMIASRKESDLIESIPRFESGYQPRGSIHDENTSKSQQDPSATQVPEMQQRPDDRLNLKADENVPIGLRDYGGRRHFWGRSRSIHSYRSPRNRPHWYYSYQTSRPTFLPISQGLSSHPSIGGLPSYHLPPSYIPQLPSILPLSPMPPPKLPQRNNVVFNQVECMKSCPVTLEYNPVCGSDNITYPNPGRLKCAQTCGSDVKISRNWSCLRETEDIGRDRFDTNLNETDNTGQDIVDLVNCIQHCPASEITTPLKCASSCSLETYIVALRESLYPISNGTKNYTNSLSVNHPTPSTEEHIKNQTNSKDESTITTFFNDNTTKATNTNISYLNETVSIENDTEESTARETYTKNTKSNFENGKIGEVLLKPYLNAGTGNNEPQPSMREVVACTQHCPLTSEYNPVCGMDGITYTNPGRLLCYQFCGINVKVKKFAPCSSDSVAFKLSGNSSLTESHAPWMQNIERVIDLLPSEQPFVWEVSDQKSENKKKEIRNVNEKITYSKREKEIQKCVNACADSKIHESENFQCGSEIINRNMERMKCQLDCGRDELAKCIPLKTKNNTTQFSPNRTLQIENTNPSNQTRLDCESICFMTTNEKKPVCGTNNVTYKNIEMMDCARQCGVDVEVKSYAPCTKPSVDILSYLHNHTILIHGSFVDSAPFVDPLDNMEFANINGTRFVDSINNIDYLDNDMDNVATSDSNYNVESSASTYKMEGTIPAVVLDDMFGPVEPEIQSDKTKEANNHGVESPNSMETDTTHEYQKRYGVNFTIPTDILDKIFGLEKSDPQNTKTPDSVFEKSKSTHNLNKNESEKYSYDIDSRR